MFTTHRSAEVELTHTGDPQYAETRIWRYVEQRMIFSEMIIDTYCRKCSRSCTSSTNSGVTSPAVQICSRTSPKAPVTRRAR